MPLTGRVVDAADLLTAAQEAQIVRKLSALETRNRHQLVVATVPTLGDQPIEQYSLCLANQWALGRKGHDDGLLLLVAPKERKVRIEVGKGLEKRLTNREAKAVIDRQILPAFKSGAMARGIEAGVNAMIAEVQ